MDKIELLGGACFSHGPYTFYKAVRIGNGRVLRLGSFFLTKLWSDADLVSIGELQLLWMDSRGPNQPLASLRLYFLPENTPDGRRDVHGEDEVLTISEKVVVRVNDLVTWLTPKLEWSWGREISNPMSEKISPDSSPQIYQETNSNSTLHPPQMLTDPGIDFSDVDKQQKDYESNQTSMRKTEEENNVQTKVVVLSYPRYCRYRALLRRLEGAQPSWLCSSFAAALGGFTASPGTRVLFCRDTFDYPDLETHELLCNHLAPKLKGRPRRKRKKRSASPEESSNESEASVASTSKSIQSTHSNQILLTVGRPPLSGVRRSERNNSAEEKKFFVDIQNYMSSRGTPIGKMPLLGYKQIELFVFYTKVQTLGGYDNVTSGRLWKSIYDDMGGNVGSTSAATITRRHYERLLLPYERYQRGEETKVRLTHSRRTKNSTSNNSSEDRVDVKRETNSPVKTPPPITEPTLNPILATSTFLPGDKPKTEPTTQGKTSSLRSVRVKPERLKSLNTMIANNTSPLSNQQQTIQLPSSPPSSNVSTANSTPSTTPTTNTLVGNQSVLQQQLNSPLLNAQPIPTPSPPAVQPPPPSSSPVTTNATAVVTLTPPPEKDMKDIKLDTKQTNLMLAQGKENIPVFEEESIVMEKNRLSRSPRSSPEIIDLETESDTSRDKIIIPSFKKRKLEILREGGLEVTAIDLGDVRPTVIQTSPAPRIEEKSQSSPILENTPSSSPNPVTQKLISVTVTPDIGHMLPSPQEHHHHHNHNHHSSSRQHNNPNERTTQSNSRVINLGTSNNAGLLQLYANASATVSNSSSSPSPSPPPGIISKLPQSTVAYPNRFTPPNGRTIPPKVTQSRSIFAHSEKMVYGNPKEILISPQKNTTQILRSPTICRSPQVVPQLQDNGGGGGAGGILDLTHRTNNQKWKDNSSTATITGRPSLEIVRVPVVPRPTVNNPLNLDTRNNSSNNNTKFKDDKHIQPSTDRRNFIGYQNVLDSRTMVSNNLEITLVNPTKQQISVPPAPNPCLINSSRTNPVPMIHRRQVNGQYPTHVPRKSMSHPPVIPNVPSLNHLNSGNPFSRTAHIQQQMSIDRRKDPSVKEHHQLRKLDKDNNTNKCLANQQLTDSRRTSIPGYNPTNHQQVPTGSNHSPAYYPQLSNNHHHPHNKFLPMIDPMYYSAFYNGLFPPPPPPPIPSHAAAAAAASAASFLPPEFSAYYKELLASSSSQSRLGMSGQQRHHHHHQPAAPTSK